MSREGHLRLMPQIARYLAIFFSTDLLNKKYSARSERALSRARATQRAEFFLQRPLVFLSNITPTSPVFFKIFAKKNFKKCFRCLRQACVAIRGAPTDSRFSGADAAAPFARPLGRAKKAKRKILFFFLRVCGEQTAGRPKSGTRGRRGRFFSTAYFSKKRAPN